MTEKTIARPHPSGGGGETRRHARPSPPVRAPARGRFRHVFAALDLGTNNCRLLVARPEPKGFKVIDAFSRTVRLGEGLAHHGVLSETAMRRAVEAVRICAQKMRRHGVSRMRAIATAACRHAENGAEFIERIAKETGVRFDIVTAEEEAHFAVAGVSALLGEAHAGAVVFDIGGGSTELVFVARGANAGEPPLIKGFGSIPLGVVTLAERFGTHEISNAVYPQMLMAAHQAFAEGGLPGVADLGLDLGAMHLLGTSGTVTTVAGIHLGLQRYERAKVDGQWLPVASALSVSRRLTSLPYDKRLTEPCIGRDRADLVMSGCAIFETIATLWPCADLRVADRGLREGMLLALMESADKEDERRKRKRRRGKRGGRRRGKHG